MEIRNKKTINKKIKDFAKKFLDLQKFEILDTFKTITFAWFLIK